MAATDTRPGRAGFILRAPGPRPFRLATDDRLLELIAGGHEAAFDELYARHHAGLLSFCRHMLGSREEAEDALQHTFLAAHRHLAAGEPVQSPRAWLYTVARNQCLDVLRARRPVDELEEERAPSCDGLDRAVQDREDLRDLLADLARLDPDARAALLLTELDELRHAEVATVLDCPPNRVKKLVFRARSTLASSRKARNMACLEVREELSVLRRGALRRGYIREHLRTCEECRAFREDVARQRRGLAILLPVVPSVGGVAVTGKGTLLLGGGAKGVAIKAATALVLLGGGVAAATTIAASEDVGDPAPARKDTLVAGLGALGGGAATPAGSAAAGAGSRTAAAGATGTTLGRAPRSGGTPTNPFTAPLGSPIPGVPAAPTTGGTPGTTPGASPSTPTPGSSPSAGNGPRDASPDPSAQTPSGAAPSPSGDDPPRREETPSRRDPSPSSPPAATPERESTTTTTRPTTTQEAPPTTTQAPPPPTTTQAPPPTTTQAPPPTVTESPGSTPIYTSTTTTAP